MLNQDFYYWEIDNEINFRKLIIKKIQTEYLTEKSKFDNWNGEYKICNDCGRMLPKSTYFFRIANISGFYPKCKECDNKKFTWGKNKKKEFKKLNLQYCAKCDTVYPLSDIYFVKLKNSSSGHGRNCKKCGTYKSNFGINRFLNNIVNTKEGFKVCLKCHVELPKTEEYYFREDSKDSNKYETICKKCQGAEYGVKYVNVVYKNIIPKGHKICKTCGEVLPIMSFYFKHKKENRRYSNCKRCHYIKSRNRIHSEQDSEYNYEDWDYALKYWTDKNENIHCVYCDEIIDKPEMEHIIPFSKNGKFERKNIIPACKSCNRSKNNKILNDFFNYSEKFTLDLYSKILGYIKSCN